MTLSEAVHFSTLLTDLSCHSWRGIEVLLWPQPGAGHSSDRSPPADSYSWPCSL